jgi:hypothetical protein
VATLRGLIALGIQRLRKEVIVMDEIDGLSERGGVGELASILRKTNIPILCIANEKPPKLKIFRGMDNVDKIGLIKALTPPIAAAAIKAAKKVDKFTPGTTKSTTNKLRAVATNVNNDAIINFASDCFKGYLC